MRMVIIMQGKNHLLFGTGAGITSALVHMSMLDSGMFGKTFIGAVGCCMLGSVFCDLDNPKSMVGSKLKIISKPINKLFGHRTFLHSLLPLVLTVALFYILQGNCSIIHNLYFIQFYVGFIGHLIQDTLSSGGVAWFYPFQRKRISLCDIKYGSKKEFWLTLCLIFIYGFLLLKQKEIMNFVADIVLFN